MAFRKRIDFQRPSGGVCLSYRNGYCDKGTACNFIHQEDDGRQKQIFVGNLHHEVGEDDLLRLFDNAGKVEATADADAHRAVGITLAASFTGSDSGGNDTTFVKVLLL